MTVIKGKVIVFSAPSGAGKTTIVNKVITRHPDFSFSVSATTRPRRGNEVNGREYFFVTVDQFKDLVAAREFLEYQEVYPGRFYGTLITEVERIRREGKHPVFDVDVKGGINIKRYYGEEACSIFIEPPSLEALRERLIARGTESMEEINKRLSKAALELESAPEFDHVVINDDLDKAVAHAERIIQKFLKEG